VHTDGVKEPKETGSPDDEVALKNTGDAAIDLSARTPNEMDWLGSVTVKLRSTFGAAA
jgi:hypothetical protein